MPRGAPDWFYGAPQKGLMQLLREGNAFGAVVAQVGAANNWSHVQLWNHVGSGVEAYVYRIEVSCPVAVTVWLGRANTAFTTDYALGLCARFGLPFSKLHARAQLNPLSLDIPLEAISVKAGEVTVHQPVDMWVTPGYGFTARPNVKDTTITACIRWYEFVEY